MTLRGSSGRRGHCGDGVWVPQGHFLPPHFPTLLSGLRKMRTKSSRSQHLQKQPRLCHLEVAAGRPSAGCGLQEAWLSGLGDRVPSPLEAAQDESRQGHQGDAHDGRGHQQPDDGQCVRGVVLGHELALKGEAERQQREPPQMEPSEGIAPCRPRPSARHRAHRQGC